MDLNGFHQQAHLFVSLLLFGFISKMLGLDHVSKRAEPSSIPPFVVFDILVFIALFFLSATYLSALFSKSLARMKTWFALMISCILYCISFLLLVGHQAEPDVPPMGLCLFQAGMIYAAPPSVAAAGLAFVIELYLRLSSSLSMRILDDRLITAILFLPAVAHQAIFWIAIFNGFSHQLAIERDEQLMFCHINTDLPTTSTGVTVVLLIALMIIWELYTMYYLWRRRSAFRELRRHGAGPIFPFRLFIRVGIYTFAGGFGIIMVDIFMNKSDSNGTGTIDLLAVIPLSVALVFGTQEDIVRMYMFWKKKGPPPPMPDIRYSIHIHRNDPDPELGRERTSKSRPLQRASEVPSLNSSET